MQCLFRSFVVLACLAAGTAAFCTPGSLPLSGSRSASKSLMLASVRCQTNEADQQDRGQALSRRGALQVTLAGVMVAGSRAVSAADKDEDDDIESPGSVPREITYKADDKVCEAHPNWKQCKKMAAKGGPRVKLDSGLLVSELVVGKGNTPQPGDTCTVHYSLFYKGNEIESSRESQGLAAAPIGFQYGVSVGSGSVIPAISQGIEGMKVGGVRRVIAPPELAFGEKGKKPRIPGGATVEFDIQLLTVKRAGTNPISSQGRGSEKNTGLFDLF